MGEPYRCADLLLHIHAFARGRNDYSLGPYSTDSDGVARITRSDLEADVDSILDSDLMGHYAITECRPYVEISLWTPDEIVRAQKCRLTGWTSLLSGERRRWASMEELLALYSRALIATRSLLSLHAVPLRADWTDPAAKHSYDLRLKQPNAA
jgi:hypothetical protein